MVKSQFEHCFLHSQSQEDELAELYEDQYEEDVRDDGMQEDLLPGQVSEGSNISLHNIVYLICSRFCCRPLKRMSHRVFRVQVKTTKACTKN